MSRRIDEDVRNAVTVTANAAKIALCDSSVTALKGISVFDVGQGDCIGMRDQKDVVFCYLDYGGVNDHPDKGNPSNTQRRLPVRRNGVHVPIILTHWDKDHFWSANIKNPDAQNCEWLVPRQKVSGQAVRFAANLANAKCWPEGIADASMAYPVGSEHEIEIRKCDQYDANRIKEDRNITGLAVSLRKLVNGRVETTMLLPGDCPFELIPNLSAEPLRAFVAFHHGAGVDWTSATTTAIQNAHIQYSMAYSFGQNSYGHPDRSNYTTPVDWNSNSKATEDTRQQAGMTSVDIDW